MTDDDYAPFITDKRLQQILGGDMTKIQQVEVEAVSLITDALFERYDVGTIFAQTGSNRSATVMMWIRTIVIYGIYDAIDDKLIPERVTDNYKFTRDTLTAMQKGDINVNLPRLAEADSITGQVKTKRRWGSEPKDRPDYFVKGLRGRPDFDNNNL
jgi:hypothetical protein